MRNPSKKYCGTFVRAEFTLPFREGAAGWDRQLSELIEQLKKLENMIDLDHQMEVEDRVFKATSCQPVDHLPLIAEAPLEGWPVYSYRECFEDRDKMLMTQLATIFVSCLVKDDKVFTVRANYGVGGVASLFGCRIKLTDENAMPWVEPLTDEQLDERLESGQIDYDGEFAKRILDTNRYYADLLSNFPKVSKCVHLYVSDTQGPFDVAHLVMGNRIYTEIHDNPERVHRLLQMTTEAIERFTGLQQQINGEGNGFSYHSNMKLPGHFRICDDTGTNISEECYRQFCKPYNERLTGKVGGWIHYCGSGRQMANAVLETEGLRGVNFGNPEMQDMKQRWEAARSRDIAVLFWIAPQDFNVDFADTGITVAVITGSIEDAQKFYAEATTGRLKR